MLFDGIIACFSPSVDASMRLAWVNHGGSLTNSKKEFYQAKVFFCNGVDDPWLKELLSRSLVVRHARWISKSVSEQFAVPVSKYLLDDQFDPTKIEPTSNSLTSPSKPLTPNQLPADREERPGIATKLNTLKRAFGSENRDESSTEIDFRPLKRARTQLVHSPQVAVQTSAPRIQSPAPAIFPTRASRTDIFYPSPANSSPLESPNNRICTPHTQPPRRIDFTAFKPTPAMPVLSFPRPRPASRRRTAVNPNNVENIPPSALLANNAARTSIAAVLRADRADASAFVLSQPYKDKVFAADKIPQRKPALDAR
ncbi:hypothetical protein MVEN_01034400 [Mycena venus]|uniref:BRCT domain-containing protein n=1 Tax=Mycena venus TaxID=2733690 RepID=A0A8H7D0G0_9AGAR|nr:hypothetical protein MVEN_01034400 [Mycena venus]